MKSVETYDKLIFSNIRPICFSRDVYIHTYIYVSGFSKR